MHLIATYLIGVVFGLGIVIAGMSNPAKVLNFFDIAGTWDPSLALVMGSALTVAALGFRIVLRGARPAFGGEFSLPTARAIDARLIGGSAVFGIGWGIAGVCPGGALPALGTGRAEIFVFTAALIAGLAIARFLKSRPRAAAPAP